MTDGDRGLPLQRRRGRRLSLRLERLLRLVSRTRQAGAARARTARPRPRRARRPPGCSTRSSSCCIRSCRSSPRSCGRSTARAGPARDSMLALAPWPELAGLDDAGGRGRDRLAGRPRHRDPLGARRDERAAGAQIPLVLVGASRGDARRAPSAGRDMRQAARAAVGHLVRRRRAARQSVQLVVRGEVAALPLAGVIDLAAERARLDKEIAKARRRHRHASTPSSAMPTSSPARRRRWSRAAREARGGGGPPAQDRRGARAPRRGFGLARALAISIFITIGALPA